MPKFSKPQVLRKSAHQDVCMKPLSGFRSTKASQSDQRSTGIRGGSRRGQMAGTLKGVARATAAVCGGFMCAGSRRGVRATARTVCTVCGFVVNRRVDAAIVIATIGRHGAAVPIVDEQGQAQVRRIAGLRYRSGRALRGLLRDHTVAQIAHKRDVMAGNGIELATRLRLRRNPGIAIGAQDLVVDDGGSVREMIEIENAGP